MELGHCPHCGKSLQVEQSNKELNEKAKEILAFLNERTGKRYKPVAANIEKIRARLKEGYTEAELRQVVVRKCRQWLGDEKMEPYLRPATLFNREKMAQYSGELVDG